MKLYLLIIIGALTAGGAYWSATNGNVEGPEVMESPLMRTPDELTVPADGEYFLDAGASGMSWQGRKPLINDYFDSGTVALASGSVTIGKGDVRSGWITVGMDTIAATDTGRGSADNFRSMLTRHLQSEDFFDVEQFPTSTFTLDGIFRADDGSRTLKGDLTVKGITKSVSFPVTVTNEGGVLSVTAEDIELDRTEWDIRFGSGRFFQNLGDNLIDDIFAVSFTAVFRAAP